MAKKREATDGLNHDLDELLVSDEIQQGNYDVEVGYHQNAMHVTTMDGDFYVYGTPEFIHKFFTITTRNFNRDGIMVRLKQGSTDEEWTAVLREIGFSGQKIREILNNDRWDDAFEIKQDAAPL